MKHIRFKDIILWEDDGYVVISKPPHIATLEDRQDRENILLLARHYIETAQVCHRLDKDTSGVLAIAKNPEAYRNLSMQFEKRTVIKKYHAVVDGVHDFSDLLVDEPLRKKDDGLVIISRNEGKPAQTYVTSIRSFKMHTLVQCRPVTGRMHQIRVHLSLLKAPIAGDVLYGGRLVYLSGIKKGFNLKKDTDEQPLMKRMALHAFSLEFNNMGGKKVIIEAPYPKDFNTLTRQLALNT